MDDLISRKEAIEWVQNILATHLYYHPCSKSRNVPIDEVIDRLERVPSIDAVPMETWQELKETVLELRDNGGTATQKELSEFLLNLMDVLEGEENE